MRDETKVIFYFPKFYNFLQKFNNKLQFPVVLIYYICKDLIFRIINKHLILAEAKSIQKCLNMCQIESKDTKSYQTVEPKIKIKNYSIEHSINKEIESLELRKNQLEYGEQLPELTKV